MEIVVNVPRQYHDKKLLDAIGMGLLDLAVGERPDPSLISIGETVTVRLKLSENGAKYWNQLLPEFGGNKRRLAREALCLVAQEPESCLACRI